MLFYGGWGLGYGMGAEAVREVSPLTIFFLFLCCILSKFWLPWLGYVIRRIET